MILRVSRPSASPAQACWTNPAHRASFLRPTPSFLRRQESRPPATQTPSFLRRQESSRPTGGMPTRSLGMLDGISEGGMLLQGLRPSVSSA